MGNKHVDVHSEKFQDKLQQLLEHPDNEKQARQFFKNYDTGKTGQMSRADFYAFAAVFFKHYSLDGDAALSDLADKNDYYDLLFRITDLDKNGSISFEEYLAAIKDKDMASKIKKLHAEDNQKAETERREKERRKKIQDGLKNPDNIFIVAGNLKGQILIWKLATVELRVIEAHGRSQINSVCSSSDGHLISSARDKTIKVWNVDTLDCTKTLSSDNLPDCACLSEVCGAENMVRITFAKHDVVAVGCALSADVSIIDVTTGNVLKNLTNAGKFVLGFAVDHEAKMLAISRMITGIEIVDENWNVKRIVKSAQAIAPMYKRVFFLSTHNVVVHNEKVEVYHENTFRYAMACSFDEVCCFTEIPNKHLLIAGGKSNIDIYDYDIPDRLKTLEDAHASGVTNVVALPDDTFISSGYSGKDFQLKFWDPVGFSELRDPLITGAGTNPNCVIVLNRNPRH